MYKMKIIETKGEYDRWKLELGKGGTLRLRNQTEESPFGRRDSRW